MNDPDQDLGERDQEEPSDFPPAERTIHTQAYDLSLSTLKEQWDDGTLQVPDFQREYVWDNAKASRLVESFLLNIPVPVLYFSETPEANYEIVDGHQRVFSLVRYIDNQFGLSGLRIQEELKGKRFHQLPEREQRYLKTRTLRAIIIGADSHPTMKFETFERLNTGGLALNAQEIRNAIYSGALNSLLRELENDSAFLLALGLKRPRKRMVDRELVLRFIAMRNGLTQYRTPLVRFLNDFMRANREPTPAWLAEQTALVQTTAKRVAGALGSGAFRVIDQKGRLTEKSINRALFETQMLAFSYAESDDLSAHRDEIVRRIGALFSDSAFDDAIRRATGDKTRMQNRLKAMLQALVDSGVKLDADGRQLLGSLPSLAK